MTAEETALEEFRVEARNVRFYRRVGDAHDRNGSNDEAERAYVRQYQALDRLQFLARIIRAIRAERGQERIKVLRGVQGACEFHLEDDGAGAETYPGVLLIAEYVAKAAEETAR